MNCCKKNSTALVEQIKPEVAFYNQSQYPDKGKLLQIQELQEIDGSVPPVSWKFNLAKYLTEIENQHPGRYSYYLVGYRGEEQAVLKSLHSTWIFRIPFFVIHALPRGSADPSRIVSKNSKQDFPMSALPLKWIEVDSKGLDIKILGSRFRRSSAVNDDMEDLYSAGCLWFPEPVDITKNPAEAFKFPNPDDPDDEFFFDGFEMWRKTRNGVMNNLYQQAGGDPNLAKDERVALKESMWEDLCKGEPAVWVETVLEKALNKFFLFHEELDRQQWEEEVKGKLEAVLYESILTLQDDMALYDKHSQIRKNTGLFKVYPENEYLQDFLSEGHISHVSEWAGVADGVFPSAHTDFEKVHN